MNGHDTDVRRLNELAGSNVEFREFGVSTDAISSDWSLLNAVSRSSEPVQAVRSADAPSSHSPAPYETCDWSMLASVAVPPQRVAAEVPVRPQPAPEQAVIAEQRPTAEAAAAKPSFGHLFRKTAVSPAQDAQGTDLVQLLKAISRCH